MSTSAIDPSVSHAVQRLEDLFPDAARGNVAVRLWDGTEWPDARPRAATLVLKHPDALREMFGRGTEKGLAEAYLRNDFDVEGDLEVACGLADVLAEAGHGTWFSAARRLLQLRRRPPGAEGGRAWTQVGPQGAPVHSRGRDRQAVAFHYDVSNDFYRLWLDSRLLYSCAYFERVTDDLETAQRAKLDHLCRKLRLRPGQRLLDIGCGWGGLALYAAQHYGVKVRGVTLSERQAELAGERVRAAGCGDTVTIELRDYREVASAEPFDAIVSVGMAEHVGAKHLPDYFRQAFQLLQPGGVFLNHAIGDGVRARATRGPSFIQEYVFPDTDLPPIASVLAAAGHAGFEVRDVENLREHYALTLRHWVRRLESAHLAASLLVSEPTFRIWRLYMAGSARGFATGRLAIYQTLLARPDDAGRVPLPLTRRDWYPIA